MAAWLPALAAAGLPQSTVRQEQQVTVDGVTEQWRLTWQGPTRPACGIDNLEQATTCPCIGFAYGEQGRLTLERHRPGAPPEQMPLGGLFAGMEGPAADGNAALRRWDPEKGDPQQDDASHAVSRAFADKLAARPRADVMALQDIFHNGQKTAFLLQVGSETCGKRPMVAVGVTPRKPKLHAITTRAHPEKPLTLFAHEWKAWLASRESTVSVVSWRCGDHGAETQSEKKITLRDGGFEVRTLEYQCGDDGKRGKLTSNKLLD